MRSPDNSEQIFIFSATVDMRKSYGDLSQIVETLMKKNLFDNSLFVFPKP